MAERRTEHEWEHFVIKEDWSGMAKDWKQQVAKIEDQGWEIVSISSGIRSCTIYVFAKRKIAT